MDGEIRISYEELQSPEIDLILARQATESESRRGGRVDIVEAGDAHLIHESWFNLLLAGLIGAFIAWILIEPHIVDGDEQGSGHAFLVFASVGGLAAMMIGGMDGFLSRNFSRAMRGMIIGGGIGFVGGLVSAFFAGIVFALVLTIGISFLGDDVARAPMSHFSVVLLVMIARSLAWAVAGMTVGLGPGIALRSKKLTSNGFLGGMIGGAIGGVLFDPINYVVSSGTFEAGAEASRAIGFCVIGATAGLMIGLVEMFTKDAWLLMTSGALKGKQFVVYKNPTLIGSSSQCEIYLFKDPSIEPMHAAIHTIRDGYEIEDRDTRMGTLVNGSRIRRHRLVSGDQIQIGESRLVYSEREKTP